MKKIFACIAAATSLLAASPAAAQAPLIEKRGVTTLEDGRTVLTIPTTTLEIGLLVQKETIRRGPYARYAQKYLGVVAPLADKTVYTITDASICTAETTQAGCGALAAPQPRTLSHAYSEEGFTRLQPDKWSFENLSQEEQARQAAQTIYTLRKRRFDLVTGEAGEHVFGGGLQAALDEMARMEQEYLALFLGKQTTETRLYRLPVIPTADKTNYVVGRFSEQAGVVPADDLSAQPILLELRVQEAVGTSDIVRQGKKEKVASETFCIAGQVACRLYVGKQELAASLLPVFQFGKLVEVAVSGAK